MTRKKQRNNVFEPVKCPMGELKKNSSIGQEWVPEGQIIDVEKVEKKEMPRPRQFIFLAVVLGFVTIFAFRLNDLQIARGQENRLLAEGNRMRSYLLEAPRGQILAADGSVLVSNDVNYVLQIYPYNLPGDEGQYDKLIKIVEEVSGVDALDEKIKKEKIKSFDPIVLKEDIEREEAIKLKIKFANDPGVEIAALPKRKYSSALSLSHILGYVGKMSSSDIDNFPHYPTAGTIGKTGIESAYDEYLRGSSGEKQIEIDSSGQIKRVLRSQDPETGSSIKLHLIPGLQEELQSKLSSAVKDTGGKSGVAIAMDPRDGGVLAMVSLPDFDLNIFSGRIESDKYQSLINDKSLPLLNRAIGGLFPPGSSIKPFVAAAGLDGKVIDENTTIDTPPEITIDQWIFPDWKPHGWANVKKAIAESNNIFFYAVGGGYDKIRGLGSDLLNEYLLRFGFGSKTGIDIAGESAGLVPNRAWKKKVKGESWYVGDTYHMAIGQGDLLVTPLELATATVAVANGGVLYEPRLAAEVISSKNGSLERKIDPSIKTSDFIDGEALRIVRDGMRQTITAGSGYSTFGRDFNVDVAGKTGTAQFGSEGKTHAWFTSFAPFDNPKLVVTVFIEGGGEGYQTAAPVAKSAFEWYANNVELFE